MRFILSIVSVSLVAGQALACIGDGSSFAIGFKETAKPGELIVVLNKQKPGAADEITEALDDTGYVAMHLAITQMVKKAEAENVKTIPSSDPTFKFLRDRVTHFRKFCRANLPDPEKDKVATAVGPLQFSMADTSISIDELLEGFAKINNALYENKVVIQAATRKKASDPFGEEVDIDKLGLPSWIRTRSLSCNAGVSLFNPTPAKKSGGAPGGEADAKKPVAK